MKTSRLFVTAAFALLAAVGLSACTTTPAASAPQHVASKTTVDLMLEVRAKELELERTEQMAWLKFAADSDNDMVKGFIMGRSGGKSAAQGSTTQTVMQAQAQADNNALRREEMAYANSWDRRLLPYLSLGLDFARFDKQLGFQRWSVGESNAQNRYMFDNIRGTQQDAYGFAGTAYSQGSAATLGGVSAGSAAAAAGASAVAGAQGEATPAPTE